MHLSCEKGSSVTETIAGKGNGKPKKYLTNGFYVKLSQPEGASIAIFMYNNEIKKVWITD